MNSNEVIETEPVVCEMQLACKGTVVHVPSPRHVVVSALGARFTQIVVCSACHQRGVEMAEQIRHSLGRAEMAKLKLTKARPRRLTANEVLFAWQRLSQEGIIKVGKPIVVFGPTPGAVTEVTVGAGGNLTLIYDPFTPEEMGGKS